uniref:Uncharacterized protein n=1 Tax=Arundo donax TaxID=35708 RepID=A0A0A9CT28_ARUDO
MKGKETFFSSVRSPTSGGSSPASSLPGRERPEAEGTFRATTRDLESQVIPGQEQWSAGPDSADHCRSSSTEGTAFLSWSSADLSCSWPRCNSEDEETQTATASKNSRIAAVEAVLRRAATISG